ncbi:Hypothetical predicted protein [Scomber scombrus]|uniref:Interleukin n=1 Tax=Scomber scombrus TaxID=13677 RepID=A0AAV1NA43_SCOSC
MKNMNVQSLSLMMLISMAYAASITMSPIEKALLKDIYAEVEKANKTPKNKNVHMAVPKQGYICEKCFFHYAEKALKGLKETSLHNLTRNLKGYIKTFQNDLHCPTRNTREIHLHRLLKDTHDCVLKALSDHLTY